MVRRSAIFLIAAAGLLMGARSASAEMNTVENSIGMKLVQVPAGHFTMGDNEGAWDQRPAHEVVISKPFLLSVTEVTVEQYKRFRPEADVTDCGGSAGGASWRDAAAFCEWLGAKEGKPYRLPTEAEWEYACRAGAASPGAEQPATGQPNAWGLENMLSGVREWCLDWYGEYPWEKQTDPVGAAGGFVKAIRGGGLETDEPIFATAASRAGLPPSFGIPPKESRPAGYDPDNWCGRHKIGFRVVQAPAPKTALLAYTPPFVQRLVKQSTAQAAAQGPDPNKPYYRKRYLLPMPPESLETKSDKKHEKHERGIAAAGLHPSFHGHNHSPGMDVCPNGDVLVVIYTCRHERGPEVSLMATRLRFGAEQWDMPTPFMDFPNANDHAPLLWTDDGAVRLFWGSPGLEGVGGAFPFQWTASRDNGATWDEVRFPIFDGKIGPNSRQPINTAFRGPDGEWHVPSDGEGDDSVLWASADEGKTWRDTGGRSAGRHTTYCLLKNGAILGMGGKNTDIDLFMPQAVSRDDGATWEVNKSPFPSLGSNQRPCILRLKSGRLLFACDFQRIDGKQPAGITERGAFVALSGDEGRTWHIKKLAATQPHLNPDKLDGADTLGYCVARQAPNGVIHLITTMNLPCVHFEMNEAWILSDAGEGLSNEKAMANTATAVRDVNQFAEIYPGGAKKAEWSAGVGDDGRWLLHGRETWWYENGAKQYEASYDRGRKVGVETLWRPAGGIEWQWKHNDDGASVWTQWWENGRKKSESQWKDFRAIGVGRCWDPTGRLLAKVDFSSKSG